MCFFCRYCSRSARIKKLIWRKLAGVPKNLVKGPFPDPVSHFGALGGHFGFQGYPPFLIEGVLVKKNLFSEICLLTFPKHKKGKC